MSNLPFADCYRIVSHSWAADYAAPNWRRDDLDDRMRRQFDTLAKPI
jgi:hypothetical protein